MERHWFRLSICLKHFFTDERARCYVSVESHRPIRWLRQRLMRLFGPALKAHLGAGTFALTCRGHLLPEDEPLALLAHDDLIIVVPVGFEIPFERDNFEDTMSLGCSIAPLNKNPSMVNSRSENCLKINVKSNNELNNDTIDGNIHISNVLSSEVSQLDCSVQSIQKKAEPDEVLEPESNNKSDDTDSYSKLCELKQRAFSLLEQYDQEDEQKVCPKRKRQRVRKRRRLQGHTEHADCDSSYNEGIQVDDQRSRGEHLDPVQRNISLEVRSARIVQPLNSDTSI